MDRDRDSKNEQINKNRQKTIQHSQWIKLYLVIYDMIAVSLAFFLALWLRFDLNFSSIPVKYLDSWLKIVPFYAVICVLVFGGLKLYKSIWRFVSFKELQRSVVATFITAAVHSICITLILCRMPISYYLIGTFFQFAFVAGIRFSYRFLLLLRDINSQKDADNCMLIGAGAAGTVVLRELERTNGVEDRVVCIIDDNKNKWNRDIDGVPIVGGRESIRKAVDRYDIKKIYLAIPSVSGNEKKKILDICKDTDCELKTLPGMYQLMLGDVTVKSLRNVDVEDLLGREPVKLGTKEVRSYLSGKTILVTGGGGSIGSELCRQISLVENIKRLIIFDIYENNAHAIKLELMDKYPDIDLVTLIGSVRNSVRVNNVFKEYRPDVVFHAAAHKHVPLMEDSPCESIKNNVFGTYNVAFAAAVNGCEKFVLISTDKAVNPANVMGASKRICEMIVQTFSRKILEGKANELPCPAEFAGGESSDQLYGVKIADDCGTEFVAVRFGNVLGSNGSVIPRFREQIEAGGPVTVTHPNIIRYFMTIPEAASLVLTAATFGNAGRIFVLDMGTPVKIDDLARNMIRLSGLKPDVDINVSYTGLRPGEKLYEERLMDEEGLETTANELINIGKPIEFNEDVFIEKLKGIIFLAYSDDRNIRERIAEIVPTYSQENVKVLV